MFGDEYVTIDAASGATASHEVTLEGEGARGVATVVFDEAIGRDRLQSFATIAQPKFQPTARDGFHVVTPTGRVTLTITVYAERVVRLDLSHRPGRGVETRIDGPGTQHGPFDAARSTQWIRLELATADGQVLRYFVRRLGTSRR